MSHSAKYIIRADIRTSGVVERSDVVGAIYGQTEGLLGDELDLRGLQESSKVGRIDVNIDSEGGRSFGTVTIQTALSRAETAVLAAALETIERVGPSRAECTVSEITDARAAKRREIVDRATELLADFEKEALTSDQLVEEVQHRARTSELTEYHELPAGPRVADSDAIIVVEGRADVKTLLSHGIKNAVAVEGTDIPEPVARLTTERTTTAFLDGDRGGDLILRELAQVGDVDYVAFAPSGTSVEDLERAELLAALRKKLPHEQVAEATTAREAFAPTDGGTVTEPTTAQDEAETADGVELAGAEPESPEHATEAEARADAPDTGGAASAPSQQSGSSGLEPGEQRATESDAAGTRPADETDGSSTDDQRGDRSTTGADGSPTDEAAQGDRSTTEAGANDASTAETPPTLRDHVDAVIGADAARLLSEDLTVLEETTAEEAFAAIEDAETVPHTVVLDGTVTQRHLDVAAQRGVGQLIGADTGEFVKQPAAVRIHRAADLQP